MKFLGIDIDGTLARDSGSALFIGPPYLRTKLLLESLIGDGYTLCVWSCRPTYMIEAWLAEHGLSHYFYAVNASPLVTDDRKLGFHAYLDNRAITLDPLVAYSTLSRQLLQLDYSTPERDVDFSSEAPTLMLRGTGTSYIDCFTEWKRYWPRPDAKKYALVTICSHAKPYDKSHIHASIRKALYEAGVLDEIDYVHLSNAGVIPAEAGNDYPFNSYDWNDTEASSAVKEKLQAALLANVGHWLELQHYEKIFVYLRDGKTKTAATTIPGAIVVTVAPGSLPYVLNPDADDCLILDKNLTRLKNIIKGSM